MSEMGECPTTVINWILKKEKDAKISYASASKVLNKYAEMEPDSGELHQRPDSAKRCAAAGEGQGEPRFMHKVVLQKLPKTKKGCEVCGGTWVKPSDYSFSSSILPLRTG